MTQATVETGVRTPDFLIAGASRCGTTSLFRYLSEHPEISMAVPKELHFFNRDANFRAGMSTYYRHFGGNPRSTVVGEATPSYFTHGLTIDENDNDQYDPEDDSASRIAAALPEMKSIISLRDPVRRAYSQFCKNRSLNREPCERFLDAIHEECDGRRAPPSRFSWLHQNSYALHLRKWLDRFPADRVKVIIFEHWTGSPEMTYRDLCEFLGVSDDFQPRCFAAINQGWTPRRHWVDRVTRSFPGNRLAHWANHRNRSVGYPPLNKASYQEVRRLLSSEIEEIETILGVSLTIWNWDETHETR
jgi:hypothetical protein